MMRFLILPLIVSATTSVAQPFIRNDKNRALTFKEVQLQFEEFRRNNDLEKVKHWKSFKRYETDMVRHSNGRGEPDGFDIYIEEALRAAAEKESGSSSSWLPTGPSLLPNNLQGYAENGMGRINCVGFHPTDPNTFYVGVAQGGLWKTINGGQSYTPLTDNLPITRISDICIDPKHPDTLFISVCDFEYIGTGLYLDSRKRHTHYGIGAYKSTDGGNTWSATGLTYQLTDGDASLIRKILVSPDNASHVLACGASGMYKSTNGGTSWNKLLDSLFWDMEPDPVHDSVIYAATGWVETSNLGHAAIYKSTDFGNTWTMLNTGIPQQGTVQRIKLAVAPSNPNTVYALACDDQDGFYAVYRSSNAGSTWSFQPGFTNILEWGDGTSSGGQGTYDMALCVSDTNENYLYAAGINIWSSADGGVNFSPCSHWTYQFGLQTIHADVHAIQQHPVTKEFFVSCDGGLYKTQSIEPGDWIAPWSTNWTNLTNGMQITSFYRLSSSKNTTGRLAAGAQDNSTFYCDGSSWSTIFGGDGMDNYLDPTDDFMVIGSSQYGNFFVSYTGGFSGNYISTNPNFEMSEWVTPIVADYNNYGVLYVGNENVVQSTDAGGNWTPLATMPVTGPATEITALAVSPSNSNVIYAARRVRHEINAKGIVFRTVNGGNSFTNITSNLPDSLYYTGMDACPTASNEAVICMAGFAAGCKVFKTTNGGTSWTNISFNLPNVPVNSVKYVQGTNQIVVATDLGVFVLNYNTSTWINYSTGLPNVIVSDIEFNPAVNKAYISTFGRGIWETELSQIKALQGVGVNETVRAVPVHFRVYPAAGDGHFTVETGTDQACHLAVVDVMGRVIHRATLNNNTSQLSLAAAPGAYYVKLMKNGGSAVQKVIIR